MRCGVLGLGGAPAMQALLGGGCATRPEVVVPAEVLVLVDASPTVTMPMCVAVAAPAAGAPVDVVVRAAAECLVAAAGLEPATFALRARRSAN